MVHLHITEEEQEWLRAFVRSAMINHYDIPEAQTAGLNLLNKIDHARNPAKEVPMSIAQWHEEYEG